MNYSLITILMFFFFLPRAFSQRNQQVEYLKVNNVKSMVIWLERDSLSNKGSVKRILSKEYYNQFGLLEKSLKFDIYGDSSMHEYKYQTDSIIEYIKNYENTIFKSYTKYLYDKDGKLESVFEYTPQWVNLENGYRLSYNKKMKIVKKELTIMVALLKLKNIIMITKVSE